MDFKRKENFTTNSGLNILNVCIISPSIKSKKGTVILILPWVPDNCFSELHLAFDSSKGIDISEKMLDTAKAILESDYVNLKHKVTIEKCDVMSLPTNQKYDLITIGQALHWFPVRESLQKIKSIM